MTTAVRRSSRRDETPRSLQGQRVRIPTADIGVVTGLALAALCLVPGGDSAGWLAHNVPIAAGAAFGTALVAALVGFGLAPLAACGGLGVDRVLRGILVGALVAPAAWAGFALLTAVLASPLSLSTVRFVPATESASAWLLSLALPLTALALGSGAALARQVAGSSAGRMDSDLVRTLLSRGLPTGYVFRHHVLPRVVPEGAILLFLHFVGLLISILALDAAVIQRLGPSAAPAPDMSPVVIASALLIVLMCVGYLERRALLSILRTDGAAR